MVAVAEKAHATLGASSAHRWMECPGSIRLAGEVPTPPETEFAREGTAAHAVAELALRNNVDCDTYVGETIEKVLVTEDMASFVQTYVDHCRRIAETATRVWIEQKFSLAKLNPPADMFGTADHTALDAPARSLHVSDLKYGQGVLVEARNNRQLRYYALGVLVELDLLDQVDEIHMYVVQPRAAHPDGPIRTDVITKDELLDFALELFVLAQETQRPDAMLHAGSHCRFCPASGRCPEQLKKAQAVAMVEFAAMPLDEPPAPSALPEEVFLDLMSKMPALDDWMKAMRAHALARLERGEVVPGWKLVAKRGIRRWKDEEEVVQWLEAQKVDEDDIYVKKVKSPAQIEKVVGKRNLPADLWDKRSSGYSMVVATDPRPAVEALPAGEEFSVLTDGSEEQDAE